MLFTALAIAIILFLVQYNRRQHIHVLEKAALRHTFDEELLRSRLETQEQSFQYFSEEIHDNVGQVLAVVGMHLYRLQAECGGEQAQMLVKQSTELLDKAIVDLRSISHTLNAQYISKAGLIEALNQEIAYINSVKSAACSLEVHGDPEELSADRQTLLYRILQEAVGNTLKHAKASRIVILLRYSPGILTVMVKDNGRGFDTADIDAGNGLGFTNMQLRAGLLGGKLLLQSKPGQGTTLSLTINTHPADQTIPYVSHS